MIVEDMPRLPKLAVDLCRRQGLAVLEDIDMTLPQSSMAMNAV